MYLYQLTPTYRSLIEQYNEAESQEEMDSILLQIEQVEALFEDKITDLTKAWRNYESDITGMEAELERMKILVSQIKHRRDTIKAVILNEILAAGLPQPKVQTTIGTVRVQNNSVPSVTFEGNPKDLPEAYRIVVPISYELDNKMVIEDWKKFMADLESELKKNPELDIQEYESVWRMTHGFPQNIQVVRGKHLRIAA